MSQTDAARPATPAAPAHPGISRALTLLLAVATGAIAANVYYAQPLLAVIARSLGTSTGAAGAVITVTQLGFAVGLVCVLPLADIVKRRSLVSVLLLLDAAALAAVGFAPDWPSRSSPSPRSASRTSPPRFSCPRRRTSPTTPSAGAPWRPSSAVCSPACSSLGRSPAS
ncbi:hypothetical protein ABZT16_42095 [Streptomyces flaveolus]|uniref:hypothetical protein n=1 Tax=Streptomyces flaveolus TaxID=67297 RepID=UPI0033BB90AA